MNDDPTPLLSNLPRLRRQGEGLSNPPQPRTQGGEYTESRLDHPENQSKKPGPKTEAGKRRSSANATKHGLAGRTVLLPTDDLAEYQTFTEEFLHSLDPRTPHERELARTISDGYWRLRRVRTTEDSLYALGHDEPAGDFDAENETIHAACTAGRTFRDNDRAFVNLSIYESRIHRTIEKATKQLTQLQTERRARRNAEILEAIRLRNLNKSKNLPYIPAEDGFVYSPEEIEIEAHRHSRRREAAAHAASAGNLAEFPKKAA